MEPGPSLPPPHRAEALSTAQRLRRRPHFHGPTSGFLLAGCTLPLLLHSLLRQSQPLLSLAPWSLVALGAGLLSILAGLSIARLPLLGRSLATASLFGTLSLAGPLLRASPAFTLLTSLLALGLIFVLWNPGELLPPQRPQREPLARPLVWGGTWASLIQWLLVLSTRLSPSQPEVTLVYLSFLVTSLFVLRWAWLLRQTAPYRALFLLLFGLLPVLPGFFFAESRWIQLCGGAPLFLAALLLSRKPRPASLQSGSFFEPLLTHPERLLVGAFLSLCLVGVPLLALPHSSAQGESIGLLPAVFTAVSAACVNGLTLFPIHETLSLFGQLVVLLLVQLGGLGIMTFSTAILWAWGRRLSLRHESALASLLSSQDRSQLSSIIRRILLFTLSAEALGALLLWLTWLPETEGSALSHIYPAIFLSISAFCNAGFALHTESLLGSAHSPLTLHIVGVLIILGSLSPLTVLRLPAWLRSPHSSLPAQVRLSLVSTFALLLGGFLFFLILEHQGVLAPFGLQERLHHAWFQSVTLRTAGFSSLPLEELRPATLTLMMLWMFIGGSPGGTAGGIKTTTAAILLFSTLQFIRKRKHLVLFQRTVSEASQRRAAALAWTALASIFLAFFALQLTQSLPQQQLFFEVVSALSTTGLSLGITSQLNDIGQILLCLCMFVGRIGPLTLALAWSQTTEESPLLRPEEDIAVG